MTGKLFNMMPHDSSVILYGNLSEKDVCGINAGLMMAKNIQLESFLLTYWLREKSLWAKWRAMKASRRIAGLTEINKKFGLH